MELLLKKPRVDKISTTAEQVGVGDRSRYRMISAAGILKGAFL